MRQVRYNVAASLDGYIAGPHGEFDWIPNDPAVDFDALFARVDTVLLGRRTFELTRQTGAPPWAPGMRVYVFSRTLEQGDYPDVTIIGDNADGVVAALRGEQGGGEIWLFGGGVLFGSLLAIGRGDQLVAAGAQPRELVAAIGLVLLVHDHLAPVLDDHVA